MEVIFFRVCPDWFDATADQAVEEGRLPTFEPVISHSDFLRRHNFVGWLHELRVKAEQPDAADAWRAEVWLRRIERKVRHAERHRS